MSAARFWVTYATCLLLALIALMLFAALVGAIIEPRICEAVQTHENRTITRCS